jgi:hypothetical protein
MTNRERDYAALGLEYAEGHTHILAIRPVRIPTELAAMSAAMGVVSGVPSYADSVVMPCPQCGEDCYIGPRQKERLDAEQGDALCWMCLIKNHQAADEIHTAHLGNTNTFKPEN